MQSKKIDLSRLSLLQLQSKHRYCWCTKEMPMGFSKFSLVNRMLPTSTRTETFAQRAFSFVRKFSTRTEKSIGPQRLSMSAECFPYHFYFTSILWRWERNGTKAGQRDWKRIRNSTRQTKHWYFVSFHFLDAWYPALCVQCDSSVSFLDRFHFTSFSLTIRKNRNDRSKIVCISSTLCSGPSPGLPSLIESILHTVVHDHVFVLWNCDLESLKKTNRSINENYFREINNKVLKWLI